MTRRTPGGFQLFFRVPSRPSRLNSVFPLIVVAGLLGGCVSEPEPAVVSARVSDERGRVFLVRGWMDLYSQGIDQLAGELRGRGVAAESFAAADWQQVVESAARVPAREPVVLIGFSYGADDVVLAARLLESRGRAVDLLVTIDPVTPGTVPANVRRCVNYYQSNGPWDVFPWFRGVPLTADPGTRVLNQDLRSDRPDLLEADTAHATIAAGPKLLRELIARVLDACQPRSR